LWEASGVFYFYFFLRVASLNNLVHELIIVHLLCGMHHNMDSQIG